MLDTQSAPAKPPAEINTADLADLVASMSRLLGGLAGLELFKSKNIGLAEWVALAQLVDQDSVSNKQLARGIGVTAQRATQITGVLSKAGLITAGEPSEAGRRNELKISEAGKAQFNAISDLLKPLLEQALQKRERSLVTAGRHLKLLMRVVQTDRPDRKRKKRERAAAAAAAGSDAAKSTAG